MGDKDVKAIAVRGTKDIQKEVLDYIKFCEENPIPGVIPILNVLGSPQEMAIHDEKWHTENFPWGNSRTRRKGFWTEKVAKSWVKSP